MNPRFTGIAMQKALLRIEAYRKGHYTEIEEWAIYSFPEKGFLEMWHIKRNLVCTVEITKNENITRLLPGKLYKDGRPAMAVPDFLYFDRAQALTIFTRDYL